MFVYVMALENGQDKRIKIGMAANPFERLKQLRTGQHQSLIICHAVYFLGEMQARYMESRLHDELSNWRCTKGGTEWFNTKSLKWIKTHACQQTWRRMHPACAEFFDKRIKGTPLEVQAEIARLLELRISP